MVDDESGVVVVHVRQKRREVVAAKVQEQTGKGETGPRVEEVERREQGEMPACGLICVSVYHGLAKYDTTCSPRRPYREGRRQTPPYCSPQATPQRRSSPLHPLATGPRAQDGIQSTQQSICMCPPYILNTDLDCKHVSIGLFSPPYPPVSRSRRKTPQEKRLTKLHSSTPILHHVYAYTRPYSSPFHSQVQKHDTVSFSPLLATAT